MALVGIATGHRHLGEIGRALAQAPGTLDPHLSVTGTARARALARALDDAGVTGVIVSQYSNTVADIVAALGAGRPAEICDPEYDRYDRMEIVGMAPNGRAWRIESRYGAPTPPEAGCASMR